jgi:anti-anti-sigma factor
MLLSISRLQVPPVSDVSLVGELDLATSRQLQMAVLDAVRDGCPDIRLDLGQVGFMDMSGVRAIAWCDRRVSYAEGHFSITTSSRAVDRILGMAVFRLRGDAGGPARDRIPAGS